MQSPASVCLRARKEKIEKRVGGALEWRALPDMTESQNHLSKDPADTTDRRRWGEQHAWLLEKMETSDATFRPIVTTLDPADSTGGDGEDDAGS